MKAMIIGDNKWTYLLINWKAMIAVASVVMIERLPAAEHPNKEGVVYVVSNDPVEGGNAILAYRNNGTGHLSPLPGSPVRTGGTGYATKIALPHFGPFDLDQAGKSWH